MHLGFFLQLPFEYQRLTIVSVFYHYYDSRVNYVRDNTIVTHVASVYYYYYFFFFLQITHYFIKHAGAGIHGVRASSRRGARQVDFCSLSRRACVTLRHAVRTTRSGEREGSGFAVFRDYRRAGKPHAVLDRNTVRGARPCDAVQQSVVSSGAHRSREISRGKIPSRCFVRKLSTRPSTAPPRARRGFREERLRRLRRRRRRRLRRANTMGNDERPNGRNVRRTRMRAFFNKRFPIHDAARRVYKVIQVNGERPSSSSFSTRCRLVSSRKPITLSVEGLPTGRKRSGRSNPRGRT